MGNAFEATSEYHYVVFRCVARPLNDKKLDPDYGGDYLSVTTIASMRDLGYIVADANDFNGDGKVDLLDRDILEGNFGATDLQIDSIRFGDANRDRTVDVIDLELWRQAVPELTANVLVSVPVLGSLLWRPRCSVEERLGTLPILLAICAPWDDCQA